MLVSLLLDQGKCALPQGACRLCLISVLVTANKISHDQDIQLLSLTGLEGLFVHCSYLPLCVAHICNFRIPLHSHAAFEGLFAYSVLEGCSHFAFLTCTAFESLFVHTHSFRRHLLLHPHMHIRSFICYAHTCSFRRPLHSHVQI